MTTATLAHAPGLGIQTRPASSTSVNETKKETPSQTRGGREGKRLVVLSNCPEDPDSCLPVRRCLHNCSTVEYRRRARVPQCQRGTSLLAGGERKLSRVWVIQKGGESLSETVRFVLLGLKRDAHVVYGIHDLQRLDVRGIKYGIHLAATCAKASRLVSRSVNRISLPSGNRTPVALRIGLPFCATSWYVKTFIYSSFSFNSLILSKLSLIQGAILPGTLMGDVGSGVEGRPGLDRLLSFSLPTFLRGIGLLVGKLKNALSSSDHAPSSQRQIGRATLVDVLGRPDPAKVPIMAGAYRPVMSAVSNRCSILRIVGVHGFHFVFSFIPVWVESIIARKISKPKDYLRATTKLCAPRLNDIVYPTRDATLNREV
jgi:hypothetical protein